jgi:outer membrane protein W
MNKPMVAIAVLALLFSVSQSNAESKMSLSVGADVLIPTGTFADGVSTGFGGSVRFQYNINPMFSAGLTTGYYTWSGKDITEEGITVKGATFKGLPVRVFGKYYFMPVDQKVRVYGIAELGLFFSSVDVPAQEFGGYTYGGGSESSSDFNYAPGLGVEFPVGGGNTKIDVSVRYDGIATSGSSSGSIGGRVGVNFPIGN